jgi:hypothetical protein
MEVPLYALFYEGEMPPVDLPNWETRPQEWGSTGRDARTLGKFRRLFSQTDKADISLLLFMAQKIVQKNGRSRRK